jgi:NAD(P)H-nitrite reductase large subunit
VTVFGDETHVNYNRVLLSSVLAGEKAADDIVLHPLEWYRRNNIDLHVGVRIVDVDPVQRTVTGNDGSVTPYDLLLLATGSSAWMPPIEGLDKDGVFVFRTLDDTRELIRRSGPTTHAVVIGGGSLSGGEGSILGSMIGALIMAFLRNGCQQVGWPNYIQEIIIGAIIVVAVAIDRWRTRT